MINKLEKIAMVAAPVALAEKAYAGGGVVYEQFANSQHKVDWQGVLFAGGVVVLGAVALPYIAKGVAKVVNYRKELKEKQKEK